MIIQIGPYPPRVGGISVYIKRLKHILDKYKYENEVWTNSICDEKNVITIRHRWLFFYILKRRKDIDIIHFHYSGIRMKIMCSIVNVLLGNKVNKITTIHGDSRGLFNKWTNKIMVKALNSFDTIICVKKGDKQFLKEKGVKVNIVEENAFIKPICNGELPRVINDFISKKDIIISSNASSLNKIYSIEECINLIEILKNRIKNKNIGLVFLIPQIDDISEYNRLKQIISSKKLTQDIILYNGVIDFCNLIYKSSITIRATKEDGYGVSLAESIAMKTIAIASDVCERPYGTITFKTNQFNDMVDKVEEVINNFEFYNSKVQNTVIDDCTSTIISIYDKVLNERIEKFGYR